MPHLDNILVYSDGHPYTNEGSRDSFYGEMWSALNPYTVSESMSAHEKLRNAGLRITQNRVFYLKLKPTTRANVMVDEKGREYVFFASEASQIIRSILSKQITISDDGYFSGAFTVRDKANKFRMAVVTNT